jgi:hypothetical protein
MLPEPVGEWESGGELGWGGIAIAPTGRERSNRYTAPLRASGFQRGRVRSSNPEHAASPSAFAAVAPDIASPWEFAVVAKLCVSSLPTPGRTLV